MTGPRKAVGRVYVRVIPDTKGFAAKLKKDLEEIRRKNPLKIIVDADFTKVEAELRRLTSKRWTADIQVDADTTRARVELDRIELQLQRLTRRPWTINVGVTTNPLQYRRIEAALDRLTRDRTVDVDVDLDAARASAELTALTRDRKVDVKVDVDRSALSRIGGALSRLGGAAGGGGGGGGGAGGSRGSLSSSLTSLLTMAPRALRSMAQLRLTLGTVIAAAAALAPAIATISQALLVIPALALAGAAAIGVLGIAFSNFTTAEGAAGDVRRAFEDMKEGWETLRTAVQDNLFADLADPIRELGQLWLPMLTTELGNLAASMNGGIREMIAFFTKPTTIADTATGLQNTAKFMDGLARATQPFLQALTDISVIGSEFLPGFGDSIANAAQQFADFIRAARDSGELKQWIQNGIDGIKSLGRSIRNITQGFGAIFDALGITGLGILSVLETVTETFKALANDPVLQSGLKAFFDDARAALDQLFTTAVQFLPRVVAAIGPALGAVATTVADILSRGIAMMTPVIEALGPPLEELAQHVDDVFGPIIDDLGPVLESIGQMFITLGTGITDVFGAIVRTVGPIITRLQVPIQNLITSLSTGLVGAIEAMGPGLDILAGAFERLEPTISSFVETWLPELGRVFSEDIAPALGDFAENVLPPLLDAVERITPLLGDLAGATLTAIGDFVAGALPGITTFAEKALPQITSLIESIDWAQLGTDVGNLFAAFGDFVETNGPLLIQIFGDLQGIVHNLITIFVALEPILSGITSGILWFVEGVLSDMGRVTTFVSDLASGDWDAAWNDLMPPVEDTTAALKGELLPWLPWLNEFIFDPILANAKEKFGNFKDSVIPGVETTEGLFKGNLLGWAPWIKGIWNSLFGDSETKWDTFSSVVVPGAEHAEELLKGNLFGWNTWIKDWASGIIDDISSIFSKTLDFAPTVNIDPQVNISPYTIPVPPGGPGAAHGAVVMPRPGGSQWTVGEAGQREIITPEPLLASMLQQSNRALISALTSVSNAPQINLDIHNHGSEDNGEQIVEALDRYYWTHGG